MSYFVLFCVISIINAQIPISFYPPQGVITYPNGINVEVSTIYPISRSSKSHNRITTTMKTTTITIPDTTIENETTYSDDDEVNNGTSKKIDEGGLDDIFIESEEDYALLICKYIYLILLCILLITILVILVCIFVRLRHLNISGTTRYDLSSMRTMTSLDSVATLRANSAAIQNGTGGKSIEILI